MSERTWVKGANGLWHSFDPVIRRQRRLKAGKDRIAEIRARLEVVLLRNGWTKPKGRWCKPKVQAA